MRDKQVKADLDFLNTFESLAHALQEVSIIKMQSVRDLVLEARSFHDGLASTYKDVRATVMYDPNINENATITPTKDSVVVLFSANASMYGALTEQVYQQFKAYLKDNSKDDVVILGKLGRDKFERDELIKRPYTYFALTDVEKLYIKLLKVIAELIYYKRVTIFYGSFLNVFTQEPRTMTLPGNMLPVVEVPKDGTAPYTMDMLSLLEPSAKELEAFFSSQVMGMIFRQTLFEFELARNGARVTSLEKSIDNTMQQKKKLIMLVNKAKRNKETGGVSRTIAFFRKQQKGR